MEYMVFLLDGSGRKSKTFGPCDYDSCVHIAEEWRLQGTTRLLKLIEVAEWNPPYVQGKLQ